MAQISNKGKDCGRAFKPESFTIEDPDSGLRVVRLTSHRCHSNHLYFTNPGWWNKGRDLLFISERRNQPNLFSVNLDSHEITQMTDLGMEPNLPQARRDPQSGPSMQAGCLNPAKDLFFFNIDNAIWAVHLRTYEMNRVWKCPSGWRLSAIINATSDGRYICTSALRKLRDCWPDWCDGHHSRIYRIDLAEGRAEVVHEDDAYISHVNTSPARPDLLTFCHEGAPWRLKSRIWGLNMGDGKVWPIRPLTEAEGVNHEWWFPDGERIGFMASRGPNYKTTSIGWIRWDSSDIAEYPSNVHCIHYYGNSTDLIVGDGTPQQPYLFAWSLKDGKWLGPKVVCYHGSSFVCQAVHAHPRISPDRSHVILTSDASCYGNVYRVDLKPFDQLPDWPLPEGKGRHK